MHVPSQEWAVLKQGSAVQRECELSLEGLGAIHGRDVLSMAGVACAGLFQNFLLQYPHVSFSWLGCVYHDQGSALRKQS